MGKFDNKFTIYEESKILKEKSFEEIVKDIKEEKVNLYCQWMADLTRKVDGDFNITVAFDGFENGISLCVYIDKIATENGEDILDNIENGGNCIKKEFVDSINNDKDIEKILNDSWNICNDEYNKDNNIESIVSRCLKRLSIYTQESWVK